MLLRAEDAFSLKMHPNFKSGVLGKKNFASKSISLFLKYTTVLVMALVL